MDKPLPRLNMSYHKSSFGQMEIHRVNLPHPELISVMNDIFSEEINKLVLRVNELYCMEGEMTDEWMNEIDTIEETLNLLGVSY